MPAKCLTVLSILRPKRVGSVCRETVKAMLKMRATAHRWSRTWRLKLGRLFAPHDRLANELFRLCSLREDLKLELLLLTYEKVDQQLKIPVWTRRSYLLRRMALTVSEARELLCRSKEIEAFLVRAANHRQARQVARDAARHIEALRTEGSQLRKVRSKLAAHADRREFKKILRTNADYEGRLQVGLSIKDTEYDIVAEVTALACIGWTGGDSEKLESVAEDFLAMFHRAHDAILLATDLTVQAYLMCEAKLG